MNSATFWRIVWMCGGAAIIIIAFLQWWDYHEHMQSLHIPDGVLAPDPKTCMVIITSNTPPTEAMNNVDYCMFDYFKKK